MAVFPEQMNRLDPNDMAGSLRVIENYIRYMTERMEFANSNTTKVVTDAGVSSVGLYQSFVELTDAVALAQTNVNTIANSTTALNAKVTDLDNRLKALEPATTTETTDD